MVNDKYVVKYLDPRTGKYEYATIKDVGDLQKLNTKVKTSIVDAINSISTDGIGGLRDDLNAIGETIKSLEDGTLELGDFQSIDDVVSREIEDAINSLKLENSGLLQLTQEEINKIVSNAESEYRDNIATSIRELETSKTDLVAAREKMITIGKMLENANIDYSNLTQVVDSINLYITDIIEKTDFDMVNGIVSDYKTAVTQTQDGWGVDASKNMLSYLTGRVKSNETSLNVQHGLIEAKVGKDEFQYMTVDNLPAGKENMLHNTFDLRDWDFSSAFIFKSADDYRFTSIVQADSAGENITGTTDELEQGVTYAISTYVNVQNKNKEPGQEKYAPTDGLYTATVIIDGDTIELNNVVEDNSALDGWKRVSGTFIAKRTAKQDIKFYVTAFNRDTQVGYLSAPKFEKGSSATSWVPHIEDNVSTMLSQNAVMRVLSDRITSSVEEVRETKDAFETATSTFDQMADGFELNTNKLTEVLDKYGEVTGVQTQQASELKVLNESITSKVWKQDINTTIDTINIDTSNRIVNSAFNIYSYDEQTGKLKLDYWDSNTGFEIKKHSQSLDNYLYAKRSNATSVNPISIKSSPFALRDGEKILFNFEYLAVGNPLDNDNVFTLEMYDNNDVRVGLQEFRLSELKKEFLTAYDVGDSYKYNGTYIVKNSSVVKGTITLKLPKNGELWLTKVMLQNAGIGTIGWTPSSVDNQIIQSKLSTEINQLADSIELVATDERLDAINGLLVKKDGKVVISPEAIISRVTSQELGDNALITQTSIKQTEDNLRFDLVDKDGVIQTINASAEGLLIDFDKVHIDGEVIARMISAQAIDVTQGFRLTDNNGNTLLAVVNDNGTPTLSITKEFRVKFGEVNDKLDVTIVGVVEEFYYSVDPDEPLGGRWTSTPNAFQGGDNRFIWKRTKIIYQSGDTSYYPSETGINITGSWEYEKESVTAEVVKALDSAETAKELAVSEANQALADANKYADQQDALITQQVNTSVSNAISEADQAKQIATDSYNNAVSKAEELAQAQSTAFNKKFEENTSAMSTLSQEAKNAEAKAQSALTKAGANANVLATHQSTLNTINNTTIPNVNKVASDAMAEAKSAISSASSAMSEAKKADGKIADYVTKKGLVNGTTVDSKINTATGEINKKITTVEGKIPTEIGGRNLIPQSDFSAGIVTGGHSTKDGFQFNGVTYSNENGEFKVVFPTDGSSSIRFVFWSAGDKLDLQKGEKVTLSFKGRTDSDNNLYVRGGGTFVTPVIKESMTSTDEIHTITFEAPQRLRNGAFVFWLENAGVVVFDWMKLELGGVRTDWTPAPEDNYTQEEFKIFESTYDEDVKGINSTLTELSNKKLDGTTYTDFYTNEYKKTAQGVTDTYAKVNKIIDANGNSTDAFAKAVYDKNATRQSADFQNVTKNLVKTATYTAGINGINNSISSVEGKIDDLSRARNLLKESWHNSEDSPAIISTEYGIKSWNLEKPLEVGKTYTFRLFGFSNRDFFVLYTPNGMMSLVSGMSNGDSSVIRTDNPYNGLKNRRIWEKTFTLSQAQYNNMVANKVVLYNYPSSNSGNGEVYWATLVEGTAGIDWSPSLTDQLGKAEFTVFKNEYDETDKEVKRRLLAIDSGKKGSVLYNANEALSTAQGNTRSITSLNTKVDGLKIGGRNLVLGTSDTPEEFNFPMNGKEYRVADGNLEELFNGGVYTASIYIDKLSEAPSGVNIMLSIRNANGSAYNQTNGDKTFYVGDTGVLSSTFDVAKIADTKGKYATIHLRVNSNKGAKGIYRKPKLEKGNKATDWTPAPEEMLGQADFTTFKNDYDETAKKVERRLTAIDSSAEGSFLTRLNATESTASGNSKLITTINNSYVTQSNIDETILSDKQIIDTRNANQLPSWYMTNYPKQQVREFKLNTVMGLKTDTSGTYGVLTTDVQWGDTSGGTVKQQFVNDDATFTRTGNSNGASWGAWATQVDTSNKTYQKVTETSSLYERVLGSTEANVKSNMARIVMTDSSFQTEIVDKQDLRTAMASGTGMTSDPYFNKGANGIGVYDNGKTNTITVKRTKIPSTTSIPVPKGNDGYRLDIAHSASSATTPNRGGIMRTTMSWANGTVVVKFVALLPTGRSFVQNNNSLGTGYTQGWLTDNKGTGKWETYMYYYRFGNGGTFSSFGHLSVAGSSSAFTWYLSEYDIINVNETSASKITQLSDNINLKVSKGDISNQININSQGVVIKGNKIALSGDTTVDGTFWTKQVNAVKVKADRIEGTTAQFNSLRSNVLTANSITSTMINANTAMFDKLFSTTSATTRLVARGAWITNANIVSLDASKITAGTINSARINAGQIVTNGLSANVVKSTHIESSTGLIDKIFASDAYIKRLTGKTAFINSIKAIDISASKITGTNSSFVQSSWNAINSRLSVTGSELKYTHSDGSYTRINANGIQTVAGGSSYQHNYLTHIANVTINSGSAGNVQWVQLPDVFKGKQFRYFMGVTDIYGALGDGAYAENKMALKRFVLIKSPKHNIDYANARIPILGYAHYIDIVSRKAYFRALQGIVVAQY